MTSTSEARLQQQVLAAYHSGAPLCIVGGASKDFYGGAAPGAAAEKIHLAAHRGVRRYDADELVITARAGASLAELDELLARKNQMLGFEPPQFTAAATLGGAVAAGLAGPRRPFAGAARDFVLGVKMLNGKGEILRFGGRVMKNVAGFDIARLMAGAMGVLGILLEISLRVAPRPPMQQTLLLAHANPADAVAFMNQLARRPLPLSAVAWHDGKTRIRLSASAAGVNAAAGIIGGEVDSRGDRFWQRLRDHRLPFFRDQRLLLRVSAPPATDFGACLPAAAQFIDWGGAQRWVDGDAVDVNQLQKKVVARGGHLTRFRRVVSVDSKPVDSKPVDSAPDGTVFQALDPAARALHQRLKHAFDPAGILNPGRLYPDF